MHWHTGSVSAERVGQGAAPTWLLLGLAVKGEWLAQGGPILDLVSRTGLENSTVTL